MQGANQNWFAAGYLPMWLPIKLPIAAPPRLPEALPAVSMEPANPPMPVATAMLLPRGDKPLRASSTSIREIADVPSTNFCKVFIDSMNQKTY